MPSVVDIYNLALSRLGISFEIESETETNKTARVMNRFYPIVRDYVLRDFPWPFAKRVKALSLEATETFIGWTYVYTYPNDCLAIRQIVDESGARILSKTFYDSLFTEQALIVPRYPYQVAIKEDQSARLILTDLDLAYAYYTARVTNVDAFDQGFIDSLAWKLAAESGPQLQVDKEFIGAAFENYGRFKLGNQAQAMAEGQQDREADSPSINIR
jgi:hypothetical protein